MKSFNITVEAFLFNNKYTLKIPSSKQKPLKLSNSEPAKNMRENIIFIQKGILTRTTTFRFLKIQKVERLKKIV